MKNHIIITLLVLFGSLGLNAQVLLSCTGSKTNAKISFISKSGQDISLRVDWDEGSTFTSRNLAINNGTCTDCSAIGGIGRPNGISKEWTIRQTDPNKPVSIAWATSGTIRYCGSDKPINVPSTTPVHPTWTKMPGAAKEVVAGGSKVFVIGTDDRLYEWSFTANAWVNAGRTVKSAAVDKNNSIWTVEGTSIFRFDGSWKKMPGAAKEVVAGGSKVFVIGTDDRLYEWSFTANAWVNAGRTIKSAAVDMNNSIWTVEGTTIFRYDGSWKKMPGAAKEVVAGGSKVFVIGTDDLLYEWSFTANAWVNAGRTIKSAAVDMNNSIWTVEGTSIFRFDRSLTKNPGAVKEVVAGGSKVLVIGTDDSLYEWSFKANAWVNAGRTVKSAAVDKNNSIWTVEGTTIFRYDGSWKKMPGAAKEVVAGGSKVFVIGTDDRLYEWSFTANAWVNAGRTIKSAAVDKNNSIWTVEGTTIFRYDGSWKKMPGAAKEVVAGGSKVFVIGTDDRLYEWSFTANAWVNAGRTVKSAAVDMNNSIWTVEGTSIFRFNKSWTKMPGAAKEVVAGGSKVFVIGTDDRLYEWSFTANAWVNAGRTIKSAAVDMNNSIWTVEGTTIFRYDGSWKKMPGAAKEVVAGGSKVFVIGTDDRLYEWSFTANAWVNAGRTIKSAAVDMNNSIWTVEGTTIFRYDGSWKKMPGAAKEVVAGGSKVFVIGTDDRLYEWSFTANAWVNAGRTIKSAAVDMNNSIWTVEGTTIFRFDESWTKMPGAAKEVEESGSKVFEISTEDQ